ncbi:hypothetical protein HID58_025301 [Brassica napus]|uniref:Uncharacterized protein n=1 Tax=Brassica napus TaxID=3708 RepID=A0ABQ8CKP8_BRANA|nr:hypothetical protein HID58_025301 [Brassica napus]
MEVSHSHMLFDQVFQWLFKLGREIGKSESFSSNGTAHEAATTLTSCADRRTRKSSTRGPKHKNQRNYRRIWLWCQKDVAGACFYSTLNLRRLGSLKREHLLRAMAKMKAQVGEEKEVPLTRFDPKKAIKALEPEKHEENKKEKVNSEKTKAKTKATLSRMKELIKWAAAAKSDKAAKFFTPKIMELRNGRKLKTMREANEESKRMSSASISLRWESCESCTTSSSSDHISIVSAPANFDSLGPKPPYQCRSRKGNWITTDSECKTIINIKIKYFGIFLFLIYLNFLLKVLYIYIVLKYEN